MVDGAATLERDGRAEAAEENVVLLAGDRLRTGRGRVEVLFDDGSALHLDEHSSVDLLSDSLIRLLDGRLRLQVARTSRAVEYRVDAAPASALIRAAGEYRISLANARSNDAELRVVVMRGSAEIGNAQGRTQVRAGTEAFASADRAPSLPYSVNSASWDEFERWAQGELDQRLGVQSSRYLPTEVRYYGGQFDQYGILGLRAGLRQRVVPDGLGRLAAVLVRPLVVHWPVRLDVDRSRPVVLGDAPLRPLGPVEQPLVLDS